MPRPLRRTFRLLRRLLTALSFLALIAVVVFWIRAHWTRDKVERYGIADDPRTVRRAATFAVTTRGSLYVAHTTVQYELTDSPAAETVRQTDLALAGWRWSTGRSSSVEAYLPDGTFLGFRWKRDPLFIQSPAPTPELSRAYGWHTAQIRGARFALPWWFLALLLAILPALSLGRYLRKIRRRPGTCPACGYDLRASPTRCPECGRPTTDALPSPTPRSHNRRAGKRS